MEFATTTYDNTHLTLGMLLWKLKIQIFCRYSVEMKKCKQIAFKCIDFNSCMRMTTCWVYLCVFTKILSSSLNAILNVDKHCSDVCCDKFPVPQIDRNIKQIKQQWHGKFYLQSVWGKLAILDTKNIKFVMNNKVRSDKNAIWLHSFTYLLNICRKIEFLISKGSVATCLRWGG